MPDTLTRIRGKRVTLGAAVAIMAVVLSGLILVVGFGNDYTSCRRTAETRANSNVRLEHAASFWRDVVAASRDQAAHGFAELAENAARVDGPLARLVARSARAQAATNANAAAGFRDYAAQLYVDRATVPDCAQIPPPR